MVITAYASHISFRLVQSSTVIPMLRAVPATMLMAASTLAALRSGILMVGDLPYLVLGELGNLLRCWGWPEADSQAAGLLDKNGRGGSLGDEGVGAILVHRDDDRDNQAGVLGGALVELLAEAHYVHADADRGRAYGRCGRCLAGGVSASFTKPVIFFAI